ncbi:uncharacterized protein LOC128880333 isoform X1 [Hylaeus volcanicus]|uniref:uncharacterized protein LOC128880333 isoform X1 n=1 Tax=Hylaeus volcanicus TaxID=313075 RepID=UPI0023B793B9|nr:uncharacterized protein LOC128880333 isoform X1 [Hylaeus volcanicus]
MSKWNERLVTSFLKVYKQYPCLWNPYHKDYHNCREKNEALQKIIDEFGTPGFTAADYLQQIKIIREKYKREQTRTIKGLQSQKRYKSPFSWYGIVSDMLTKVIDDERKANSETILKVNRPDTSVLKSLSSDSVRDSPKKEKKVLRINPCTTATCNEPARRSKSARSNAKSNLIPDKISKAPSTTRIRYVPCPQARTSTNVSRDREEDTLSSYRPTRDTESRTTGYPMTVPYTTIDPTSNDIIGADKNNYEPPFLQCPLCGWEDARSKQSQRDATNPVQEQRIFTPCSDYYSDLSRGMYTPCTGCDRDSTVHPKKHTDDSGDFEIRRDPTKQAPYSTLTNKSCRSPVTSMEKLGKNVDVEIQCNGEVIKATKGQIIQLDPVVTNKSQGVVIEACARLEILLSNSEKNVEDLSPETAPLKSRMKEASVNTVNYVQQETQYAICASNATRRCVSLQTLNQVDENRKWEHYVRNSIPAMKSKKVAVNVVDTASKGIQSTICVSRGNLARSLSLERVKDAATTPSVREIRSSICITTDCLKEHDSNSVRHIGIDTQRVTRAKSNGSVIHCIRRVDSKESVEGKTQEFKAPCTPDTCPRNMSEIIKDPTVAFTLQQLLYKMLSSRIESRTQSIKSLKNSNTQTDYRSNCNAKRNCKVDVTEVVDRIKEFAMKTLGSAITSRNESTQMFALEARFDKPTMIEESDFNPIFESTGTVEDATQRISVDDAVLLKEAYKFPAVDKEVSVYSESRDIGTDGSSSRLLVRNVGVQNGLKNDTDKPRRVSVGTQKRDPILVRVIKCNESQTIVKSDKETLTDVDLAKKYVDEPVGTCDRSSCLSYAAHQKKYERQLDSDYYKRSCKDYICDKNCKNKLYCDQDWTDVSNIDAFRNFENSKIPLSERPRKCTFARCK